MKTNNNQPKMLFENTRFSNDDYRMKTKFILPLRVVLEEACENSAILLEKSARQPFLGNYSAAGLKPGSWVLLDFGRELQGGIDVTIQKVSDNATIRIVFGESVSEAMSSIGEKNATNDHSTRDMILPVTNWQHFRIGNTGFRFVKIEAINGSVDVSGVQAAWEYYDAEYKGSFESDDELLNIIWETGAYTAHLNMNEYVWDGIKRDRLVWIGDLHPEISTIYKVFGDVEVVRKSLDFIRDVTPVGNKINGIASYTLWWIIIQNDWYRFSGNKEYLENQREYIVGTIESILQTIDMDGVCNVDNKFIDWSSKGTNTVDAGYQAILAMALDSAAELCKVIKHKDLEAVCLEKAALVKRINYPYEANKQVAALTALAGINDIHKVCENIIIPNGGHGLSTFLGYQTLRALGEADHMNDAITIIKEYWGAMLSLGATTFWEDFDLEWVEGAGRIDEPITEGKRDIHGDCGRYCYEGFRHSLCHGWASGPTAFLSDYVSGIKMLEPGFKKIKLAPQLGTLNWVKINFPTPYGCIHVEHKRNGAKIESKVELPEGIELVKE